MIGKTIGNYEITGELAEGGMGAVYRARHVTLPREVVVKSILLSAFPPQSQEPLKARFLREALVQSQLDHPNIVRVLEFFMAAENYFLVMEYVDGMSLRDLLKRQGRLAADQALPLFKQSLSALDYAHNFSYMDEAGGRHRGITHRDIKPGNLLLDGMARLKLTDFGIVKMAGEQALTRTGFNPGTAEYMSPEQIRGQQVDARSDLYSLGVTFYEMLAGRLPFPHTDTGSEYEIMRGHIELTPPPLAEATPGIPAALAAIVMQSLEKDASARHQTAAEFLQALLAFERRGATAPQTVRAPQPQVTHSMTEPLAAANYATNPATDSTRPRAPQPDAPPTNVMPAPQLRPAAPPANFAPAAPVQPATPAPARRTGLLAAIALLILAAIGATAFWFWRQNGEASTTATVTTPSAPPAVAPSAAPSVVVEDERLRQARAAEAEEKYREAIQGYEAFLAANPQTTEAAALKDRVALLKQLSEKLAMGELGMKQKDYAAAKRDFAAALKLRRESKRAQAGLMEAEAGLGK